ncbi:MAG TPA: VWA domain-containing protein [Vicinamibacterales bacterium]|nr:VWA domain-containing protein [Vicinamibacterales bacterium]
MYLLHNLLHFGEVLHSAGLDVPAGRMIDVARALEFVDVGRRTDFYITLRSLLVHRRQDFALFDDAFRTFWRRPPGEWSTEDLRAMGEQRRLGPPQVDIPPSAATGAQAAGAALPDPVERVAAMSYSDREISRTKDFAEFTDTELEDARRALTRLSWDVGRRRTRRWIEARHGRAIDLRRAVAHNMRYGGELLDLPARSRKIARRPLVLMCDVSGSMERYTRMLLHFVHGLSTRAWRIETFLFATRLTRVTRELQRARGRTRVQRIPWTVPDWGGGTRIGDALRTFNTQWRRRVMGHGPVVLLISDGWDRGEPEVLRREMARLQRSSHRLIWLNPLLGSPDYLPLTRGMQAALPFVDDFLPVHNLESLEALSDHLNRLDESHRRP